LAVRPEWWAWYLLIATGALAVTLVYQALRTRRGGAAGV
jgi:hypothetical protein